ncbi:MAG: NOB1 family endonuclease [Promethearchaeota archaeon]
MSEKKPIFIFDTNIFLMGIEFNIIDGIIYTTPRIIEEIKNKRYIEKNRNIINRIDAAINNGKLLVKNPLDKYLSKVEIKSRLTGDYNALSKADKELIALTLELLEKTKEKTVIYTNDYSIENLCSEMGIPYSPLLKKGIKSKVIWEIYCPFCKDIHDPQDFNKICDICGSTFKRRPKK